VYLPAGALALWLLGQVAVWVPARRAARLSPVAALRS
jgi:putative ABC transport system permease protein